MKAKKAAAEKFPAFDFQFTFHDPKAQGISDLKGSLNDKEKYQGIKTCHKRLAITGKFRSYR